MAGGSHSWMTRAGKGVAAMVAACWLPLRVRTRHGTRSLLQRSHGYDPLQRT